MKSISDWQLVFCSSEIGNCFRRIDFIYVTRFTGRMAISEQWNGLWAFGCRLLGRTLLLHFYFIARLYRNTQSQRELLLRYKAVNVFRNANTRIVKL